MSKPVIGVTQFKQEGKNISLKAEKSFFEPNGLGRQLNPVIGASVLLPDAAQQGEVSTQTLAGLDQITYVLQGQLDVQDASQQAWQAKAGDVLLSSAGQGATYQQQVQASTEFMRFWLNVPAAYKQEEASAQLLPKADIPEISLLDGQAKVRVIAGAYDEVQGPLETATAVNLWEVTLAKGQELNLPLPGLWYALLFVLEVGIELDFWPTVTTANQMAMLGAGRDMVHVTAAEDTRMLVLSAEGLDEAFVAPNEA